MDKNWISVAKAAARMGVSEKEVMRLIDSYRLAGVEGEDGGGWVRGGGGGGRGGGGGKGGKGSTGVGTEDEDEDEDEDDSTAEAESEDEQEAIENCELKIENCKLEDTWISGFEAAGRLGIGKVQVGNLALKGLVRRVRDYEAGMGLARGRGKGQPGFVYLEADVEKLVKLREERMESSVDVRKGLCWYGNRSSITNFRFQITDLALTGKGKEIENCQLKIANCKL